MRLYAPMYEGDSFLRPDATIGAPVRPDSRTAAAAPDFVRSNMQTEAAYETALDILALVHAARMLRSIEVARLLKAAATSVTNWLKVANAAVVAWFDRVDYQERDSFFAASANLADLEQRQRHWERTGQTHY
jgi:hypothetical protein